MLKNINSKLFFGARYVSRPLCRSNSGQIDPCEVNFGENFLVHSFLLAGGLVKDIAVNEFGICLEVSRRSLVSIFIIFKNHSLLNFDFLVDIVS